MKRKNFANSSLLFLAMAGDIFSDMYYTKKLPKLRANGNFEKLVKEPERVLRSFSVHGTEIKAYSKKDAIKKYKHLIKKIWKSQI